MENIKTIPKNDYITLNPPLVATHPKGIILIFYLSTMVCVALGWSYYFLVLAQPWLIFLLPLEIFGIAYVFILSGLFFVKIAVTILERKYPPQEGEFERDGPEMKAYQARSFFKYYAIWLTRNSTFPWMDKIAYAALGVPVGKTVVLHEAWVDPELVEVGDYVMIGEGSVVMSHCVYQDKFIVKKVTIEDQSLVGAFSILAPGTQVKLASVLGANSSTSIDQVVEERCLYAGSPAKKLKKMK